MPLSFLTDELPADLDASEPRPSAVAKRRMETPAGDPSIPCRQIRVLGLRSGGRGLSKCPAQPPIAFASASGEVLTADSLLPGHMPAYDASWWVCSASHRSPRRRPDTQQPNSF